MKKFFKKGLLAIAASFMLVGAGFMVNPNIKKTDAVENTITYLKKCTSKDDLVSGEQYILADKDNKVMVGTNTSSINNITSDNFVTFSKFNLNGIVPFILGDAPETFAKTNPNTISFGDKYVRIFSGDTTSIVLIDSINANAYLNVDFINGNCFIYRFEKGDTFNPTKYTFIHLTDSGISCSSAIQDKGNNLSDYTSTDSGNFINLYKITTVDVVNTLDKYVPETSLSFKDSDYRLGIGVDEQVFTQFDDLDLPVSECGMMLNMNVKSASKTITNQKQLFATMYDFVDEVSLKTLKFNVIDFGNIIENSSRIDDEFTVNAYVVINDVTYVGTKANTYITLRNLITYYTTLDETKDVIAYTAKALGIIA